MSWLVRPLQWSWLVRPLEWSWLVRPLLGAGSSAHPSSFPGTAQRRSIVVQQKIGKKDWFCGSQLAVR